MNSSIRAGLATSPLPTQQLAGPGGRRLAFSAYPAPNPWLHLLISHGYGEHRGWYDHVARAFQAAGISAYTFDHFHHGISSGKPGDAADYAEFPLGVRLALEQGVAPLREAGVPLALFGHSNGGLAVLHALGQLEPGSLAAVVLCNPLLGLPRRPLRWDLWLSRLIGYFNPGFMIAHPSVPGLLTANEAIWPDYARDPLRLRALSQRFYKQMAVSARRARTRVVALEAPLLLLLAGREKIVRQGATLAWFSALQAPAKERLDYPGLHHELLQETEWQRVVADVVDWLRTLAPPKAG